MSSAKTSDEAAPGEVKAKTRRKPRRRRRAVDRPDPNAESALQRRLGYEFRDRALLHEALTHRSLTNENPRLAPRDNERLEFLGDAIIGYVAAALLFERFPDADEGELTQRRADLVCERSLAILAREIGLGDALRLGKGEIRTGGRENPRLLASALEAVIGAIRLDGGSGIAFEIAQDLFEPHLLDFSPGAFDYKSRLQYRAQAELGETPYYALVDSSGPEHNRVFEVSVFIGDRAVAKGEGRNKLRAEQCAAKNALEIFGDLSVKEEHGP
ncbi:MAG: ribonuclease III [Sandaracinaceae bacterium]|nr:ribonuclease III [Sandaracinaceae bacterium]